MSGRFAPSLFGLATLVLLTGCQSKFTHERFEMIQVGVDEREDVRYLLGDPVFDVEDQWVYDVPGERSAIVYFDDEGRVAGKEWGDPQRGRIEGENPNADRPPPGDVRARHTRVRTIDDD